MIIEYRPGKGGSLENAQSIASGAWDYRRNWMPEDRRRELKEETFWRGFSWFGRRESTRRQKLEKDIRAYQIDAEEQFSSEDIYCVEVRSLNNGTQIF